MLHPHPGSLTRTTSGLGFSQSLPHSRSRRRMFASAAAWLVSRRSGRRGYRVPCTRVLRLGMRVSAGTQVRQTHTTKSYPYHYVRSYMYDAVVRPDNQILRVTATLWGKGAWKEDLFARSWLSRVASLVSYLVQCAGGGGRDLASFLRMGPLRNYTRLRRSRYAHIHA